MPISKLAREGAPEFLDNDVSIWRYMNFGKFVSLLDTRELFFPSLETLAITDPSEGSFPRPNHELHMDQFREMCKDSLILGPDEGSKTARETTPKEREERINEMLRHEIDYCENYRAMFPKLFISCWHASEIESAAMWQLYGPRDGSISIRSKVSRLESSLEPGLEMLGDRSILTGRVAYINYASDMIPVLYHRKHFGAVWYKRDSYSHEREVRVVFKISEHPPSQGVGVPVDIEQLVEDVHVSPWAPDYFHNAVLAVCRKFGLGIEPIKSDLMSSGLL